MDYFNYILLILFLIVSVLCVYIDISRRKIISLSSIPLMFFMTISFFSLDFAPDYLFIFRSFNEYSEEYYYTYVILILSILFSIIISNFIIKRLFTIKFEYQEDIVFLKKIFYASAILSIFAFLFNINNALDMLFGNSVYIRDYEEQFGANSVINYFYFLHVIAIPLYYYISYIKKESIKFGRFIIVILVLSPFFHGIKFTVFDAFFPTIVLYYFLADKIKIRVFLFLSSFALIFLYLFFTYARGVSDTITWYQAIINYIIPNYYNLGFVIKNFGYDGLFDYGFDLLYPAKLPKPENINNLQLATSGFLLNFKYNMYTAILPFYRIMGIFSGIGYGMFIILVSFSYSLSEKYNKFRYYFIFSILVTCNFLSFYYWMLFKLKYIWLVVFMVVISILFRLSIKRR